MVPTVALSSDVDTDGDGLSDIQEDANRNGTLDAGETDLYNADSDDGGESDGSEVKAKRSALDKTDDMTYDTDGDGWVNGIEVLKGTEPRKADSDGDGVPDPQDPFPLDATYATDRDSNGLPDDWEKATQLQKQPLPQSKSDDPDNDGLKNAEEFARGTNPVQTDTDRDGIDDLTEINEGTNPKENACLQYVPSGDVFPDIKNHWSAPFVTLLHSVVPLPWTEPLLKGYVTPKGAPIFAPDRDVTRYEFLKMVMLSTCIHLFNPPSGEKQFTDVPSIIREGETSEGRMRRQTIYTAVHYGIAAGYSDGSFKSNDPVNRAEAVKMLTLAAQIFPEALTGAIKFPDVSPEEWYASYVKSAADAEIVSGYSDGTFGPERPITRAEAAKIVSIVMRQNALINGYVLPEKE